MTLAQRTKKQLLATQVALKRRQNNEAQLEKELGRFFRKLKKSVLKELNEYWSDYQLLQGQVNLMLSPIHEAHKEYYEIIKKYKLREYELGKAEAKRLTRLRNKDKVALKAVTTIGIQGFVDKDKNNLFGTIPKAEEDLLNRTFRTTENTLNRVDSQLNQIISDGYREGKGINEVANDITKRFDQLEDWEAKRIARTEINTSHNKATRDQYKEDGVEYTQWIAADDDLTRDSHAEVGGEIIPIDGKYSNGLEYPGDMSGPIEEWINCRCGIAPFVVPYGFMAPSFSPFRESDLIKVETKPPVNEPTPVETQETYQINGGERYSNVEISQDVLDKIIQHQETRATAKIEWGNTVDLKTGTLNNAKDIKGKSNGVKVPRPNSEPFGLLHNHSEELGFSGADMFNQLTYGNQKVCVATTPKGAWIARDTEYGTFNKKNDGINDNTIYEIRNEMNSKSRELSKEVYERKYKERMMNATSRKEVNAIKREFKADTEWHKQYNDWLLEKYGVGVNKYNYFEIEFIPKEGLRNAKL